MTTLELYRKHKKGEVSKDKFIYEVRKDQNLPWIINTTSYTDAVKILKNKGIIKEDDSNITTDPAVDRVNPYFLKKGVEKILSKEKELTNDSYKLALNKAAKQLVSDPHAFDEDMFHNAKEVEKADEKLKTQEVKKDNFVDKANEAKKVKIKKSLKETVLSELTKSLKKKSTIKEDTHWKHTVGAEVHTPDGPGKISEILGSTLTVELQDGSLKDYQINAINHFTEKAQEQQSEVSSIDSKYNINKDYNGNVVQVTNTNGKLFSKNDDATITGTGEKIKITGFKEDQGKLQALYTKDGTVNSTDVDSLEQVKSGFRPGVNLGKYDLKKLAEKLKNNPEKFKKLKERLDVIKGRNATTGAEETLGVVPGGQGSKTVQDFKSKGATTAKVQSIS
jgi:hypothetical protein